MRIEFAILWSNMKLVFLPTTVTYPFQLALTNVIHGLDRMIPQSAACAQASLHAAALQCCMCAGLHPLCAKTQVDS